MPKKVERKLEAEARKHGLKAGGKRFNAYVYGTLARLKKRGKKYGNGKQH
jgi:hypothetical protein